MQIIVLGAHRSGTSVVTRLLNMMGAYFGQEGIHLGANEENLKGFWERKDVLELDELLLRSVGSTWCDLGGFDLDSIPSETIESFDRRVAELVLELDAHRPWVIKEPRLCLVFPRWKRHLEVPVCVLAHRSPIQVAHSLAKRDRLPLVVGAALWERYTLDALRASEGLPRLLVSHERLMSDPVVVAGNLLRGLEEHGVRGLRAPDPREIQAFLEPSLHRQRQKPRRGETFVSRDQMQLFEELENGLVHEWAEVPPLSSGSQEILEMYSVTQALQQAAEAAWEDAEQAKRVHAEAARRDAADRAQEQECFRGELRSYRREIAELRASAADADSRWEAALEEKSRQKDLLESMETELVFRRTEVSEAQHVRTHFRQRLVDAEKELAKKRARLSVVEQVLRDYETSRSFRLARFLSGAFGMLTLASWRRRRAEDRASESKPRRPSQRGRQLTARDVEIVVCVHNALEDTRRCLESVRRCTPAGYRLILSNDGSDGPTSAFLEEVDADAQDVTLVVSSQATGYTRAANRGLRKTGRQVVVMLNSDTVVTDGWLDGILECFQTSTGIGIVGPLSNNATYQSVPKRYGADGDWEINELPPGWDLADMAKAVAEVSNKRFPRVGFLNGFCYAIHRRVIEAIGIFDEETFPKGYGEENDYSLRAAAAGFELAVADQTYVWHAGSRSYSHERRLELAASARDLLTSKHPTEEIDRKVSAFHAQPDLADIRERLADRIETGLAQDRS